jgi:RimJ/RimL family protein N-acetyltransferase
LTNTIRLRAVINSDLPVFFEQQLDSDANYMAAFTAKDPADEATFQSHWSKILSDETIQLRTILSDDQIAGHVVCHRWFGDPEISYWIGRDFWGRGVATKALSALINEVIDRPLHARAAKDNLASISVLEKCGFEHCGEDKGYSNARGEVVEEFLLILK